ncbi:unnamed protein product, partial [marine sediment metagenome]
MEKNVEAFMEKVIEKNPGEKEFHQAVREVVESVMPFIASNKKQCIFIQVRYELCEIYISPNYCPI